MAAMHIKHGMKKSLNSTRQLLPY